METKVIIRKTVPCNYLDVDAMQKQVDDGQPEGTLKAIVSVFNNVDRGGDKIMPGAFTASLKARKPKGVWFHQWDVPIAKTERAIELEPGDERLPKGLQKLGGLMVDAKFNLQTQRGKEAFSDIAFGIIDEFSIGFLVDEAVFKPKEDVWELTILELFEWSPVLAGMNPKTQPLDIKSLGYHNSYRECAQAHIPFASQLDAAQAAVRECIDRAGELKTLRQSEGRDLGRDRTLQLTDLRDAIDKLITSKNRANNDVDIEELQISALARDDEVRRLTVGLLMGE